VALFPVPLPKPGYYAASLTDLQACVPLTACPGVDTGAVQEAYQRLLSAGGDGIEQLLQLLNTTAVCVCSWLVLLGMSRMAHQTCSGHPSFLVRLAVIDNCTLRLIQLATTNG
jgi:hypothetical protein